MAPSSRLGFDKGGNSRKIRSKECIRRDLSRPLHQMIPAHKQPKSFSKERNCVNVRYAHQRLSHQCFGLQILFRGFRCRIFIHCILNHVGDPGFFLDIFWLEIHVLFKLQKQAWLSCWVAVIIALVASIEGLEVNFAWFVRCWRMFEVTIDVG